jgi:hypothetical protein
MRLDFLNDDEIQDARWSKRFLIRRGERDVLEAFDHLCRLQPRKFNLNDVYVVSGVPWRELWPSLRMIRAIGLIARLGHRRSGGWWEITERGKIALAIQRGCEARARARKKKSPQLF